MRASLVLQPVTASDLPAVIDDILEIEALCFPRPWDAAVFAEELAAPGAAMDVIVERARSPRPRVAAFCCYRQIYDEMHIFQVATHPDARRRGLGAELVDRVIAVAAARGCQRLLLEVRPSNRAALNLYEKRGFQQIGVRKRYYADNGEDALVLHLDLAPPS